MATQLARIEGAAIAPPLTPEASQPLPMRVFTAIPPSGHGVAVLRGMVVVYETDSLSRDGVEDGAFYVVESQYPAANMAWESWLRHEREDESHGRAQPRSPLKTSREVVQALRCASGADRWWLRLPSGFTDGPIHSWAIGHNFVGRVVGIYSPTGDLIAAERRAAQEI